MAGEQIFVIEDDADIQELIRFNLEKEGYKVSCRSTGEEGVKSASLHRPDLVLLARIRTVLRRKGESGEERIADHTTNIAEDVIYLTEGQIIRHHAAEYEQYRKR